MTPTIGRIVWYYPDEDSNICTGTEDYAGCMVQNVSARNEVTVTGVDMDGDSFAVYNIPLFKPDEVPEVYKGVGGYATWMPYQVQQAEKNNG